MNALDLLSHLQHLDVRLWVENDRLRFNAPAGVVTPELRAQLVEHKTEIVLLLGNLQASETNTAAPIPRTEENTAPPLSFAQHRLWFLDQLEPGSALYNIPGAFRITGPLEASGLAWSLNEIVQRHDILRTTFTAVHGEPRQVVGSFQLLLQVVDLTEIPEESREAEALTLTRNQVRRPFDLEHGPLIRTHLLRINATQHVLIVALHHIVADGWSVGIFARELGALYESFLKREPAKLPRLPIQYADFALWQRQWLTGDVLATHLSYWQDKLANVPLVTKLPADRPLPAKRTSQGGHAEVRLPDQLSEELRAFSRQEKTTLFMTLLAAFQVLIHGSTGQEDLVVGTPVANRIRNEIEDLIGTFVNVLVLRTDLSGNPTFRELLQRVRETTLEAYSHQELPIEMLAAELRLERDPLRPFIRLAFGLQTVPPFDKTLPGLETRPIKVSTGFAKLDLDLVFTDDSDGLLATIQYSADLFEVTTIERMLGDLQELLRAIVSDPERHITTLPPFYAREESLSHQSDDIYRECNLTSNQLLIWLGQKLQSDVPLYNIGFCVTIPARMDVAVLRRAFQVLVNSSDALRTIVEEVHGIPRQRVLPTLQYDVELVDFSGSTQPEAEALTWAHERCQRPFVMNEHLFDSALIKLAQERYCWYLGMHHIVADGWSVWIIGTRLSQLYEDELTGQLSERIDLPAFGDYIDYERRQRTSDRYAKARSYWEEKLREEAAPQAFYGRVPVEQSRRARRVPCPIGRERTIALKAIAAQDVRLSRTAEAVVFDIFVTVVAVYLARVTGVEQLALGAPFHNRRTKVFKDTIGSFLEVLPLHVTFRVDDTFESLRNRVKNEINSTLRHSHYTVANPRQRNYDVLVNYQFVSGTSFCGVGVESTRWLHPGVQDPQLAIQLTDFAQSNELRLDFDFRCDVFDKRKQERAIGHFLRVLDAFLENPQRSITGFDLISDDEKQRLLCDRTKSLLPDESVIRTFEKQAEQTPDRLAVVGTSSGPSKDDMELTYSELNRRSNQLAHHLQAMGVGPEVLVGIALSRSADLVMALLAVLKAGGAYVPLDPSYPEERLRIMVENAAISVLLVGNDRPTALGNGEPAPLAECRMPNAECPISLCLNDPTIAKAATHNPTARVSGDNLAYVIYTSGSTGRPKGAGVNHRGFANLLNWFVHAFGVGASDRALVVSSLSFDLTQKNLFAPLLVGGVVDLCAEPYEPQRIIESVWDHGVTWLNCTPSAFAPLVELPGPSTFKQKALKHVFLGGEAIAVTKFLPWLQSDEVRARIVNTYGPTECTDVTAAFVLDQPVEFIDQPVPIGRPIPNTQLLVLDASLRLVPLGVTGELCISDTPVGRGYINDASASAEKFLPNPYGETGTRLYRTGDLTRHLADGNIEFLGRVDHQVKVRGFRIELGEIEATLLKHPTVEEAVVVAGSGPTASRESETGEGHAEPHTPSSEHLIAYVVSADNTPPDIGSVRDFLKERLPDYMVPQATIELDALPLTPSGKVDRNALPPPDLAQHTLVEALVPPTTETEEILAAIWCESLGLDRVGIHDNFFEVGGHSLLATQIASRAHQTFGVEIPLQHLFESPTIAQIAALIDEQRGSDRQLETAPIRAMPRNGKLPLSFAQQRLWVLHRLMPESTAYNMAAAVRLHGDLKVAALEQSINAVIRRHESLRTTFYDVAEEPFQSIAEHLTLVLPMVDLRTLGKNARNDETERLTREEESLGFDLERGPLLRGKLLWLGASDYVGLFTMHHIISDGWSVGVFLGELITFYKVASLGETPMVAELPLQYADFARWQRDWLHGSAFELQLSYWRNQLENTPPALELPRDRPRPPVQTFRGARVSLPLSKELSEALKHLGRSHASTLFMVLLAALNVLLFRYTRADDIVIGSTIAGRNRAELEGLIGFFINALALRTKMSADLTFEEMLARVRKTCLEAYAHQDLPFDRVVEELQPGRDMSRNPFFQICFNMVNVPTYKTELPELSVELLSRDEPGAKFDLTLYIPERAGRIELALVFNTQLFDAPRISIMLEQLASLLSQVVEQPDQHIGAYSLLTRSTTALLPNPAAPLDNQWEGAIQELFARAAEQTPERMAIVDTHDAVTYEELNRRSNALAHYLLSKGLQAGDVVAIYGHRSAALVWALMAVLKAGAAFTILDPAYPVARLMAYLSLAQPRGWLRINAAGELPRELRDCAATLSCSLDLPQFSAGEDFLREFSDGNPELVTGPEDLAYVAFTSGSTGEPKGVLGKHGPITHFLPWQRETFELGTNDRFMLLSGLAYNHLQRDIFTPLSMGGTVYIPDEAIVQSAEGVLQWIMKHEITVLTLTPARGRLIADASQGKPLPSVHTILLGGDTITWQEVARIRALAPRAQIVGVYGATETQRAVSHFVVPDTVAGPGLQPIPLGRGIKDVQVLILRHSGEMCGVGELGEICFRSPHLAKGYLADEPLTRERFIVNPLTREPSDRLYRTGEMGRYLPDGNVQFVSRGESRVNIRGFRIELSEVETALRQHEAVHDVVVVARELGASGSGLQNQRLVAYIVGNSRTPASHQALRAFVRRLLPEYMVPASFVAIDALPLTPNGKVDHDALPEPARANLVSTEAYVPPSTPLEETLATIWRDTLGIDEIGVHDNFFELGGHSFLATQMISRIRQQVDANISLRELFEAPTIADMAETIEGIRTAGEPGRLRPPIDLAAEAVLEPAVRPPKTVVEVSPMEPAEVLLTGATGFLGAYLLRDLLDRTRATIHCLVRAENPAQGRQRIQKGLERCRLWQEAFAPRIVPVVGDLSQSLMGLTAHDFERLAQNIHVVYHNGAWVNHVYPYVALKPVNVLGTRDVLRFACTARTKPVHFISSIAVLRFPGWAGNSNTLQESDFPEADRVAGSGYIQTKWVAERLVRDASDRGLPVSIYRPAIVTGDSRSGYSNTTDFLYQALKGCIETGSSPLLDGMDLNLVPVDFVSRAVIDLSRNPANMGKTFHLANPQVISWNTIVSWLETMGYAIETMPLERWQKVPRNSLPQAIRAVLSQLPPTAWAGVGHRPSERIDTRNTLDALTGTNLECPPFKFQLLETYVSFLKSSGFLPSPGQAANPDLFERN